MIRLFHSFAILTLLAGCSTETETPATAVEEPAAKAPPAAAPSAAEARRAAQALWAATLDGPTDFMGRTALMYSSTGAFADTVELLLQNGADPNAADKSEVWTPLMFAAGEGQMEVVRVLLRHGAGPGLVDGDGDTAAEHALTKGHEEVARALRQAADGW